MIHVFLFYIQEEKIFIYVCFIMLTIEMYCVMIMLHNLCTYMV